MWPVGPLLMWSTVCLVCLSCAAGAALKQQRAALEAEREEQQQWRRQVNAGKRQEVAEGRDNARRAQVGVQRGACDAAWCVCCFSSFSHCE